MTVGELLSSISSYELAEWEAYERAFGPIGKHYSDEALAQIADSLAILLRLYGEQFEENPIPEPKQYPRPHEWYRAHSSTTEETMGQSEFDRNFS